MKKGVEKYTKPPGPEVLEDVVVCKIRSSEDFSQRTSKLSSQLEYLYKQWQLCIELWDSKTIPAWKEVGRRAGDHLQFALVKDVILSCGKLCDELGRSSSIKSIHKKCISPHLKSGPFKSYYMPLYQKICEHYDVHFKEIRNKILVHQDNEWESISFKKPDLQELITLLSYYVNLCNLINGRPIKEYGAGASNMEGVAGIRKALIDAYRGLRSV